MSKCQCDFLRLFGKVSTLQNVFFLQLTGLYKVQVEGVYYGYTIHKYCISLDSSEISIPYGRKS